MAAEELDWEAYQTAGRRRKRSLSALPRVLRSAVLIARDANPRLFYLTMLGQLGSAQLLGLQVLLGKLALTQVLQVQAKGSASDAVVPLAALVLITAIASLTGALQGQGQRLLGEHVQMATQSRLLEVTTAVELETFESPTFYDDLQRVEANALSQPLVVAQGIVQVAGGALGAIGMVVTLALIQPLLLPILLVLVVPLGLLTRRGGRREFSFTIAQSPGQRLRIYLLDMLSSRNEAKEVRAFDLGPLLRARWTKSFEVYMGELYAHVRSLIRLELLGAMATTVLVSLALLSLLALVARGSMSLAEAGAAALAVRILGSRLQQLFKGIGGVFTSSLFLEDLERFLSRAPRASADVPPALPPFTRLSAEKISFCYPESTTTILDGVDIEVRAGQVVALVGENGSGKTTLAKVLAGLFAPTAGTISWDGEVVGARDRTSVRHHVSVIFQDFVRWWFTARENIAFGRVERIDDFEGVRAASRRVGAESFIEELSDGYNTVLGKAFSASSDLSLGQWQRVAIARAFFRDAAFLVLDEPTASLDARSEFELFEQVRALADGRAVLLISHRFSTVRSADYIYVLHHGRVVERGTHDELILLGGRYAELFELQADAYR